MKTSRRQRTGGKTSTFFVFYTYTFTSACFSLPIPLPLPAFLFLLFTCVLMFGCSASAPPQNPYSCPTDSSFTIPDYCKNGRDPLLNDSVGASWFNPFAYYLYSMNPTSVDSTTVPPKVYYFNPSKTIQDVTDKYPSLATTINDFCNASITNKQTGSSLQSSVALKNDITTICTNSPNTYNALCSLGLTNDIDTICSANLTQQLTLSYLELLTSDRSTICSGTFDTERQSICGDPPYYISRICDSAINSDFGVLCNFHDKPPYPTGFDPNGDVSGTVVFDSTLVPPPTITAEYDCVNKTYATAALGFLAVDMLGGAKSQDVSYFWFATDDQNSFAGVLDTPAQFKDSSGNDFLLKSGAGSFRVWKAVDILSVGQSTPLLTFQCKRNIDISDESSQVDCNKDGFIGSDEKNAKVKVYDKEKNYTITVLGDDGTNNFSAQVMVNVKRGDTCPVLDSCYPSQSECPALF